MHRHLFSVSTIVFFFFLLLVGTPSFQTASAQSTVSTLAGNGTAGYADGTGAAARFRNFQGVAVGNDGTIYLSDTSNHRIRKVTPSGVVTTLAGGGRGFSDGTGTNAQFNYPAGLAVAADGTVYVADQDNSRIRKITPAGVVTTVAGSGVAGFAEGNGTAAQFNFPFSVRHCLGRIPLRWGYEKQPHP